MRVGSAGVTLAERYFSDPSSTNTPSWLNTAENVLKDVYKRQSEAFLKELGYADAEGIAETYKLSSGWEIDNGRWKLKLADGTYATSSWQQVKGKKYWFGADSYAVTGWQTIDEKRYYFDSSCALRTDGWLKDDGSWYWLSRCV